MTSDRMYSNTFASDGNYDLPIPPLEDLRAYRDGLDLPEDRYVAAEAWHLNADHPGFGLDAEHTAACMRQAGFTEVEIRDGILPMLIHEEDPSAAELTDALARAINRLEHGK